MPVSRASKPILTEAVAPPVTKPANALVDILLKSPPVKAVYVAEPAEAPNADAAILPMSEAPKLIPPLLPARLPMPPVTAPDIPAVNAALAISPTLPPLTAFMAAPTIDA